MMFVFVSRLVYGSQLDLKVANEHVNAQSVEFFMIGTHKAAEKIFVRILIGGNKTLCTSLSFTCLNSKQCTFSSVESPSYVNGDSLFNQDKISTHMYVKWNHFEQCSSDKKK